MILLMFGFTIRQCSGQNLALNKPYSLSDQPNYGKFVDQLSDKALTDGKYSFGLFWEQKSTLGWEGVKSLTIAIDLLKVENVGKVSFNTARRKAAGVYFPANIMVFISKDNKEFQYLGDATANGRNVPGDYAVEKFTIGNVNQLARYVQLRIISSQNNIFCDEIEIIRGSTLISKNSPSNIENGIETFIENQLNLEKRRQQIIQKFEKLSAEKFTAKTLNLISLAEQNLKVPVINRELIERANKLVHKAIAEDLNKRFGNRILMAQINPWQNLKPFSVPKHNTSDVTTSGMVSLRGNLYFGFILTNTTLTTQKLTLDYNNSGSIKLFEVYQVSTQDNGLVPDALLPVLIGFSLEPGETKLIIANAIGGNIGASTQKLTFNSGRFQNNLTLDLTVTAKLADPTLSAINWGYLTQPMIKNNKLAAASDLDNHYINVISIPEQYVPSLFTDNYGTLTEYLSPFKGKKVKKLMIEMNYSQDKYKSSNKTGTFMSVAWKSNFKSWYENIILSLKKEGYSENQVYLFPYDEVRGKNINDLKTFTNWVHTTLPRAKVYATLDDDVAIKELTPILDVSQILLSKINSDKISKTRNNEIWTYDTQGFSRTLDPIKYYRLMSWKAYLYEFSGVGFWNYADVGQKSDNIYSLPCPERDYAVIYHNLNYDILSSRRWEAFKLGMEDYEIIKQYGAIFGKGAANQLVRSVIQDDSNIENADLIIQKMLRSLLN